MNRRAALTVIVIMIVVLVPLPVLAQGGGWYTGATLESGFTVENYHAGDGCWGFWDGVQWRSVDTYCSGDGNPYAQFGSQIVLRSVAALSPSTATSTRVGFEFVDDGLSPVRLAVSVDNGASWVTTGWHDGGVGGEWFLDVPGSLGVGTLARLERVGFQNATLAQIAALTVTWVETPLTPTPTSTLAFTPTPTLTPTFTPTPDVGRYVILSDGTVGRIEQRIDAGQAAIITLLVALILLTLVGLWWRS